MTKPCRMVTCLFFRAQGFYPVLIPRNSIAANIQRNPGTIKVEENRGGNFEPIWTQADGWLDTKLQAMQEAA